MAIIGLSLDATRDYVSNLDSAKGTPEETVFVLGTLDSRIMAKIRDKTTTMGLDPNKPDEVTQTVNLREMDFDTVVYGLRGCRNFVDAKGTKIEFRSVTRTHAGTPYEVADPLFVRRIPGAILTELAQEIRGDNTLSKVEEGNSDA